MEKLQDAYKQLVWSAGLFLESLEDNFVETKHSDTPFKKDFRTQFVVILQQQHQALFDQKDKDSINPLLILKEQGMLKDVILSPREEKSKHHHKHKKTSSESKLSTSQEAKPEKEKRSFLRKHFGRKEEGKDKEKEKEKESSRTALTSSNPT